MPLPLQKLSHEFGKHLTDEASGQIVFHAPTQHSFIQAAGYLKHTRAKNAGKGVFFRGQTQLYPQLSSSLLRGINEGNANGRRTALLNVMLQNIDSEGKALRAVPQYSREALLQHYGIRTTWIDVVDNIWIALWFACHNALSINRGEEYLHFEKRLPDYRNKKEVSYAYILLLESAFFSPVPDEPGHFRDDRSETIDLRVAAPSQFVRPHAQHGLLVRKLSKQCLPVCDCSALIAGIIRVDLAAALDWIGNGTTLNTHSLFPPAFYDYGYRELLEHVSGDKKLGTINRIQA